MRRLRDATVVAVFDLFESLRSRKALVLLLLYLAGAAAAAGVFVTVLRELENAVADQLMVASTEKPGTMTTTLFQSEQFLDVLAGLLGDRALAAELITVPPIALFYSWVATFFGPALVVLTSGDAIAGEVQTGAARFALFRTDRLSWAMGKLGGQTLLLGVGLLAGAAAVWVVGWGWMAHFDGPGTAVWLVRLGLRAWVYCFAFLGLTMGISQVSRSRWWALGFALLALIAALVGGAVLDSDWMLERSSVLAPTLAQLFPGPHKLDLLRPAWLDRASALVMLPVLGALYFFAGHLWFARRDA